MATKKAKTAPPRAKAKLAVKPKQKKGGSDVAGPDGPGRVPVGAEPARPPPPPPVSPAMQAARERASVRKNHNNRTCLEIERREGKVYYVARTDDTGWELMSMGTYDFDHEYSTQMPDYPPERAAKLMVGFMQDEGGSPEALRALGSLVTITQKELEVVMAKAAKKPSIATASGAKKAAPKAAAKGTAKPTKEREPRHTVAQMMKDLIMEGKKTDDAIFAEVQKEFKLDDKKRGYVSWYRNWLKKHGKNPPEAKKDPKAA